MTTTLLDDLREHLTITRDEASWKREEARNLAMQVTALEAVAKRMDDECQVLEAMLAKHGIAKPSTRDRLDASGYSSRGDSGRGSSMRSVCVVPASSHRPSRPPG